MKQLHVQIDDDIFKVLKQKPNMSQAIRNALVIYNEHTTTDTLEGFRHAFTKTLVEIKETRDAVNDLYGAIDDMRGVLTDLSNRLV